MDLGKPLQTLLPKADAEALGVLLGVEAPLTGRRIAELAGRDSHASTLRSLERLVGEGLVLVEPAGNANLYRLNRDHLLFPAILEIAHAAQSLRARLAERVQEWPVSAEHASLFGSVARGAAGRESDIDVLVVRPQHVTAAEDERWAEQLLALERDVYDWTGNRLSWMETTAEDLRRASAAGEPIFQSWADDSILLAGATLSELLNDGRVIR